MSVVFAHMSYPSPAPVWPLLGRMSRPRPMIPLTITGPTGSWVCDGLLDSGADDTVFPEQIAALLGIDLTGAPAGSASGVGMVASQIRYAEVSLRVTDGGDVYEWAARVGFTSAPIKRALLGFAGFLQYFTATFDGENDVVELAPNGLYPGI